MDKIKDGKTIASELWKSMCEFHNDESKTKIFVSDDPIINILNYFNMGMEVLPGTGGRAYDLWRLKYDADACYFNKVCNQNDNDALKGDTMISFWMPYKYAIQNATGVTYNKDKACLDELIEKARKKEAGYEKINEHFRPFAELCHSPGNFLFLPNRGMQKRGRWYQDRMDRTLFECFPDGTLSHFFGENKENSQGNLLKWIEREKLDWAFDGSIIKDKIKPLNGENLNNGKPLKMNYFDMAQRGLLYTFINNVVKLIEYRNENICEEERIVL